MFSLPSNRRLYWIWMIHSALVKYSVDTLVTCDVITVLTIFFNIIWASDASFAEPNFLDSLDECDRSSNWTYLLYKKWLAALCCAKWFVFRFHCSVFVKIFLFLFSPAEMERCLASILTAIYAIAGCRYCTFLSLKTISTTLASPTILGTMTRFLFLLYLPFSPFFSFKRTERTNYSDLGKIISHTSYLFLYARLFSPNLTSELLRRIMTMSVVFTAKWCRFTLWSSVPKKEIQNLTATFNYIRLTNFLKTN